MPSSVAPDDQEAGDGADAGVAPRGLRFVAVSKVGSGRESHDRLVLGVRRRTGGKSATRAVARLQWYRQ